MVNRERLLREFFELVQVDSETKQEQEISRVLKEKFAALALSVEEDDSAVKTGHGSGNLICTLAATPGGAQFPPIFFTGHMDTVAPGKGIKPRLDDDGYIRSDGTTILGSDDKAGLAAMFEAIRVLKEQGTEHGRIQFVITAGEEMGLMGSRHMDPKWLDAKLGFALDSNGHIGDIAVAAPGQYKLSIIFKGKSAHAGVNPEDGISAITVAAKAVSRMQLGRIDKETTANIGSFSGIAETNVVCDQVQLRAEARSIVAEKLERQIESMRQACEAAAKDAGAEYEFTRYSYYPAFVHDDSAEVVQVAMKALENIGATPRTFHSGGGSDANVFNGMGVPTVNLAVGYEDIHTVKERIKADDIVRVTEAVLAIIEETANLQG